MSWKALPKFSIVFLLPALLLSSMGPSAPTPECGHDFEVPADKAHGDLWSSLGGKVSFHREDGNPFVRLNFQADPHYLRYDQDASLRARVNFSCQPGERPLALRFEMRFSAALAGAAELNDVMLLGEKTRMLSGAGVPGKNMWVPVRIPLPHDSPSFHALHFGAGSAWAREMPDAVVQFDLRNVVLERRQWRHLQVSDGENKGPAWKDPDLPEELDPRPSLVIAQGAPAFAVVDFPGAGGGSLRALPPAGTNVQIWVADWLPVEQKIGVVKTRAIRLLPYRPGEQLPPDENPRRFWLRVAAGEKAQSGPLVLTFAGQRVTQAVEALPLRIPDSSTRFLMYYQMNQSWTGYAKYAGFYRNAPAHFEQLARLGFNGVHIAEEPRFAWGEKGLAADFSQPGRYWQNWPLSLNELVAAARTARLTQAFVWEGLRIFTRDDVWNGLQPACECGAPKHNIRSELRLAALAGATSAGWQQLKEQPYIAVADEPGVHTGEEVLDTQRHLKQLREKGFRTFLTTHARMHDSFHRLAPYLDINALHAEDVTASAWQVPRRYGGVLWLYNGGSFNVTPPGHDRFFAGQYSWAARAQGVAQWIYTRPSELVDPLDLRRRLSDDAQFYALPGHGDQPAATPGLLGLASGIVDRRILDHAETRARANPEVADALNALHATLALPATLSEFTPARLRRLADMHTYRERLLRSLAARP